MNTSNLENVLKTFKKGYNIKKLQTNSEELLNNPELQEGYHYLVCKICGFAVKELAQHLLAHDTNMKNYREEFGKDLPSKPQYYRDKMKGKNNPAYNHGGKFSPFSKKFIKGDISKETFKKAHETIKKNGGYNSTIDYYLNKGYSEEEATKLLSERQSTFSLEKCIEKHGEEKGKKVWQKRQDKWQNNLKSKPIEEQRRINKLKIFKNGGMPSKPELEIQEFLKENNIKFKAQEMILVENTSRYIKPDFIVGNKIVEFFGTYWHASKNKYNANDIVYRKKKASDIWKQDEERVTYLKNLGYDVLIVWEDDFKNNKKKTLNNIKNFLNNPELQRISKSRELF